MELNFLEIFGTIVIPVLVSALSLSVISLFVDGFQCNDLRIDAGLCAGNVGAFLFQSYFVAVQSSFYSLCLLVEYLAVFDSRFGGAG